MRKLLVALPLAVALAGGALVPAAAHQAPCEEAAGPGHSEYARHHVVPLAQERGLGRGRDGHVPGEHRGYHGLCQTEEEGRAAGSGGRTDPGATRG